MYSGDAQRPAEATPFRIRPARPTDANDERLIFRILLVNVARAFDFLQSYHTADIYLANTKGILYPKKCNES